MVRKGSITERLAEYERTRPDHRSGTVDTAVLQAMEDLAPTSISWSMETGCGKTTILLSNLSASHVVFAVDDSAEADGSIAYFRGCPLFRAEHTKLVAGPTQSTLPTYEFPAAIDLALLDGPHGYPFPELEYYWVYPHLRPGALLIIDDIHIPTIRHLHDVIAEDEMFELLHIERTTSFFRRTNAPVFDRLADGWWLQRYNSRRFPLSVSVEPAAASPAPSANQDERVAALEAELDAVRHHLQASRAEADWWRHVADERRLKRRLARRIGDWPFLK